MMNPYQVDNRTPSPGRPLNGYQLEDGPYTTHYGGHLEMPSSDRLAEQPTVSWSTVHIEIAMTC